MATLIGVARAHVRHVRDKSLLGGRLAGELVSSQGNLPPRLPLLILYDALALRCRANGRARSKVACSTSPRAPETRSSLGARRA
eukprot:CAMPEP_0180626362 /NCGR_PEP_ID=MMETSP1037_2-20121125/37804_1 /TAXON_ID=632150 /ORGANISM="Azadinium spinosum, Strain 3D9" /LENGTH=83 /DNA_ID=CAMNT_0022646925 /DNA_START=90 /DNA_END=341 /DNA_ORIENTATION=-